MTSENLHWWHMCRNQLWISFWFLTSHWQVTIQWREVVIYRLLQRRKTCTYAEENEVRKIICFVLFKVQRQRAYCTNHKSVYLNVICKQFVGSCALLHYNYIHVFYITDHELHERVASSSRYTTKGSWVPVLQQFVVCYNKRNLIHGAFIPSPLFLFFHHFLNAFLSLLCLKGINLRFSCSLLVLTDFFVKQPIICHKYHTVSSHDQLDLTLDNISKHIAQQSSLYIFIYQMWLKKDLKKL